MGTLLEELEAARASVWMIEQQIAGASCADVGHQWQSTGGANCGCENGACSVPVNVCVKCKDCDYGDGPDADDVRAKCLQRGK